MFGAQFPCRVASASRTIGLRRLVIVLACAFPFADYVAAQTPERPVKAGSPKLFTARRTARKGFEKAPLREDTVAQHQQKIRKQLQEGKPGTLIAAASALEAIKLYVDRDFGFVEYLNRELDAHDDAWRTSLQSVLVNDPYEKGSADLEQRVKDVSNVAHLLACRERYAEVLEFCREVVPSLQKQAKAEQELDQARKAEWHLKRSEFLVKEHEKVQSLYESTLVENPLDRAANQDVGLFRLLAHRDFASAGKYLHLSGDPSLCRPALQEIALADGGSVNLEALAEQWASAANGARPKYYRVELLSRAHDLLDRASREAKGDEARSKDLENRVKEVEAMSDQLRLVDAPNIPDESPADKSRRIPEDNPDLFVFSWRGLNGGRTGLYLFTIRDESIHLYGMTFATTGNLRHPMFSPGGASIAFTQIDDDFKKSGIYVAGWDGQGPSQVAAKHDTKAYSDEVQSPVWLTDKLLCYARYDSSSSELWTLERNLDGVFQRCVEPDQSGLIFRFSGLANKEKALPTDFKGGRLMVVAQDSQWSPTCDIVEFAPNKTAPRWLARPVWRDVDGDFRDGMPILSPRGDAVAWRHEFLAGGNNRIAPFGVYVGVLQNGAWRIAQDKNTEVFESPLAWTSNGSRLLCVKHASHGGQSIKLFFLQFSPTGQRKKIDLVELPNYDWDVSADTFGRQGDCIKSRLGATELHDYLMSKSITHHDFPLMTQE